MTAQQAYNKGLDDSESNILDAFEHAMGGVDKVVLPNPKLEGIRKTLFENTKKPPIDYNRYNEIILNIMKGKKYKSSELPDDVKVSFSIFEELMQKFRDISKGGSNVGKSYKKILEDNIKVLTSEEPVVN